MANKLEQIINELNTKSQLKQNVYANAMEVFGTFKSVVQRLVDKIGPSIREKSPSVEVSVQDYGDFEFHLKFSGDTIVFLLHTNVFAFPDNHVVNRSKYIKSKSDCGYFGMIQAYNFLSDSLKYNRLGDSGLLLARIFVNCENHFYVEGMRQLGFLYTDVKKQLLNTKHIENIVELCMLYCIDLDLEVPPPGALSHITVQQKNAFNNPSGLPTSKPLGFEIVNTSKDSETE